MQSKKVLIFPSGTEIAFEIKNALQYSKFVELYGGTSVSDHSEFTYKNLITGFPYIGEDGFLEYLNKVIEQYGIECIFPAHDSASVFFSEHISEIKAQVIIAEEKTTKICRSKRETYRFFAGYDFVPQYYDSLETVKTFPVFVKPVVGEGARGVKKVEDFETLKKVISEDNNLIICEYLPGMEYTVDCFTDKHGKLLVAKMRNRERIRMGISVRSKNVKADKVVENIACILNEKLHFKGAWFFQIKENAKGQFRLMEVSPRIPGTMGLSRNQGINFPMLTLFVFWGYEVSLIDNNYDIVLDRAFYNSYRIDYDYDHVYLDYDDTLVVKNKVNVDLIKFIYQAHNEGKKIHLLSKHEGDIREDLIRDGISETLFDEIIIIAKADEKSRYINNKKAIFIDDSFVERKKVHDATGIAVFDVDMVECLIDWRV